LVSFFFISFRIGFLFFPLKGKKKGKEENKKRNTKEKKKRKRIES
jgi:hypothetical protein